MDESVFALSGAKGTISRQCVADACVAVLEISACARASFTLVGDSNDEPITDLQRQLRMLKPDEVRDLK